MYILGLQIPIWVTVLVITRDVVIVVVALIVRLTVGLKSFPPSPISRWNTGFQLAAILAFLLTGLTRQLDLFAWGVLTVMVFLTGALGPGIRLPLHLSRDQLPARAQAEGDREPSDRV